MPPADSPTRDPSTYGTRRNAARRGVGTQTKVITQLTERTTRTAQGRNGYVQTRPHPHASSRQARLAVATVAGANTASACQHAPGQRCKAVSSGFSGARSDAILVGHATELGLGLGLGLGFGFGFTRIISNVLRRSDAKLVGHVADGGVVPAQEWGGGHVKQ